MEAKLIKTEVNYLLENEEGVIIASTSLKKLGLALSLKNCQAIENGYDLDELADEVFEKRPKEIPYVDEYDFKQGVMVGFQKHDEILGDKKFSEREVRRGMLFMLDKCLKLGADNVNYVKIKDEYIESLQQTEWEVEVLMEEAQEIYRSGVTKYIKVPKLDPDGCLILNKI